MTMKTMKIKVQPKDANEKYIYVVYEPIGIARQLDVIEGMVDLSELQKTKYYKYVTGIKEGRTDYELVLNEEGQSLWAQERREIGEWMNKYGCD